eukprot:1161017-Pelagomonas_calceolata.AAC.4
MWHVCVTGLRDIGMMCYGWRADGDTTWESRDTAWESEYAALSVGLSVVIAFVGQRCCSCLHALPCTAGNRLPSTKPPCSACGDVET